MVLDDPFDACVFQHHGLDNVAMSSGGEIDRDVLRQEECRSAMDKQTTFSVLDADGMGIGIKVSPSDKIATIRHFLDLVDDRADFHAAS